MIWVCRTLKILQVTANAVRACQVVVVIDVAVHALPRRYGVAASQRKSNRAVIKFCIEPVVGQVASLARG